MNQGLFGFPAQLTPPVGQFSLPLIVNTLNASLGGNSAPLYYMPFGMDTQGTTTIGNNTLFLAAFWLGKPCSIREIAIQLSSPTTGTNLIFGVFSASPTSGFPENCLYSSHVASFAASGSSSYLGVSCDVTIAVPGWYWCGLVAETTGAGPIWAPNRVSTGFLPSSSVAANYFGNGLRIAHTYGAMPQSLVGRRISISESGTGFPLINIRMVPLNGTIPVSPHGA